MSEFPNPDKELINFLRQHRSQVPPASLDLEKRILRDVQSSPVEVSRRYSRLWLVPTVIAASLLATIVSYCIIPTRQNTAEAAKLETFIESNWHCIASPEGDVFYQIEPVTD